MIQGSICPLKKRAIFAINFTEVFVPQKKSQELKFNINSTINGFSRRIDTLTAIFVKDKRSKI